MNDDKREAARQFCFSEGWAGIGWEIPGAPGPFRTPEEYQAAARPIHGQSGAWLTAHRKLWSARVDDLVWSRSIRSGFWVGRFTQNDEWEYRVAHEFYNAAICQARRCHWVQVGVLDNVPPAIRNCFVGQGMAFCEIKRDDAISLFLSVKAYLDHGGDGVLAPEPPFGRQPLVSLLKSLAYDDLEDLVGLYLQSQGWWVVPSTAKRSTATTEFVLRNGAGQIAYVQVKCGPNGDIEGIGRLPADLTRFYLFQAERDVDVLRLVAEGADVNRLHVISREDLSAWIATHLHLLPGSVRNIVQFALPLEQKEA